LADYYRKCFSYRRFSYIWRCFFDQRRDKTCIKQGGKHLAKDIVKRESKNVFKHNYKYADRVRNRGVQDPLSHNFPYSFDDVILSKTPILKNNGYKIFQQKGIINGKKGVFEIGITKEGVIDHRFFRPIKY